MHRLRAAYGASPLHALAVLASFAVAGYAFLRIAQSPSALGTFLWFGAAIVAHDLLAFPLYSTLNLIAHRSLVAPSDAWLESRRVPALNHLRVPAILSGIAFLMFFPLILGLSSDRYAADTGLSADVFLTRWLAICAALFLGSALIYAIRLRRAAPPPGEPEPSAG
jgi:hypothetical protein